MPKKTSSRVKKNTAQPKKAKKSSSLWFFPSRLKNLKGDAAIYIVLGIIVIGGLFFAGGLFPRVKTDTMDIEGGEAQIDPNSLPKGGSKESLQLQTLKFKRCTEVAAVEFLLDNSGSMGGPGFDPAKMDNLKTAVSAFSEKFSDTSLVALRTFSVSSNLKVPFGYYKDNKSSFGSAISAMSPQTGTYQKNAFEATKSDLESAVTKYPKYDFNLIFFSDGIPETLDANRACTEAVCDPKSSGGCRCFDPNQDPTSTASQIKAIKNGSGSNIRIFSILLFDPSRDSFAESNLKTLMKSVATDSSMYFETTDPKDLEALFDLIIRKVCT